jgi:hypothetical protein
MYVCSLPSGPVNARPAISTRMPALVHVVHVALELVVRNETDDLAAYFDAVADDVRRVLHPHGVQRRARHVEAPFVEVLERHRCGDDAKRNREVDRTHLTCEEAPDVDAVLPGADDLEVDVGIVERGEERKALYVIPMEVRQENVVELPTVFDQVQTQRPQTGAGIEDQALFTMSDLERGGIATVTGRLRTGARYRATGSPEANRDSVSSSVGMQGRRRRLGRGMQRLPTPEVGGCKGWVGPLQSAYQLGEIARISASLPSALRRLLHLGPSVVGHA